MIPVHTLRKQCHSQPMTGGIEAAGDIVTGGLIAQAVEPAAGDVSTETRGDCLNCGMKVIGSHCHNCGQSARVHRTLMAFWHDFTHSILHFEGKIWRTLPLLFFKPGQLTLRYVHGERARFVSPLALFLFAIFLMFGTFNWVGMPFPSGQTNHDRIAEGQTQLKAELAKAKDRVAKLEKSGAPRSQIDAVRKDVEGLEIGLKVANGIDANDLSLDDADLHIGIPSIDKAFKHAIKNPALLGYKIQSNAYKFSWALIPISIPFVWLLLAFRREFKPYDHAIFVTYSLSFMSLLLVVLSLFAKIGPLEGFRGPLIALAPPVHMFFQLRGAYRLGIFSAAWRTVALLLMAFVVLGVFGVLLVMLGVTG